jgi:phosphomannomutase
MTVLLFDVDNTLTPPRRPLRPEMAAALMALPYRFHVAAGSNLALVAEQLLTPLHEFGFRGTFDAFVCNGADRHRCQIGTTVSTECLRHFDFARHVGLEDLTTLLGTLKGVLVSPDFALPDGIPIVGEQIIDRGSMINLAPIGRPDRMDAVAFRSRQLFVAFDEATGFRRRMLDRLRAVLGPILRRRSLRITLGGETSFDIVAAGNDKSYPLNTLLSEGAHRVTYFGDALFEGGNDAVVLDFAAAQGATGPVSAISVGGWEDTLAHLQRLTAAPGVDSGT